MNRLPDTGISHNLPAAWFALRCLIADLTHHRRNR